MRDDLAEYKKAAQAVAQPLLFNNQFTGANTGVTVSGTTGTVQTYVANSLVNR